MRKLKGKITTILIVTLLASTLNMQGVSLAQVFDGNVLEKPNLSKAENKIASDSNISLADTEDDEPYEEEQGNDLEDTEEDTEELLEIASSSNAEEIFHYDREIDGYIVSLSAKKGVLPDNTVAQVELIDDDDEERNIEKTIETLADDNRIVDKAVTFNIALWNDGEEVEPEDGSVTVSVQFSEEMTEALKDSNSSVSVFNITAADNVSRVDTSENDAQKVVYDMESPSMFTISLLAASNGKGQTVIHAANTEEFVKAIKSDTEIILEGKTYNLTRTEDGIEYHDLEIGEVNNLTIKGQDGTRIVSDSGSDVILDIWSCKNLVIENAVIGHDLTQKPAFGCDENVGVINVYESEITINNCDIFGCGWMGIRAYGCALTMNDSKIRDCSSYIADIANATREWDSENSFHEEDWTSIYVEKAKSIFNRCQFFGNGYAIPFIEAIAYVGNAEDLSFHECVFRENYNSNFCGDIDYRKFTWDWDEENSKYIYTDRKNGKEVLVPNTLTTHPVLKSCVFTKNGWQKEEHDFCTVTFLNGDGNIYKTVQVKMGNPVPQPESNPVSPLPQEYTFEAWNTAYGVYDFAQPVTSNINLYPSWKKIEKHTGSGNGSSGGSGSSSVSAANSRVGKWYSENGKTKCWLNDRFCTNGVYTIIWHGKPNQYYFDKDGYMQTGWINGHYYSPAEGDDYGADITSASLALGSFGYASSFSDDIREHSGILYSLKKWKDGLNSIGVGTYQYLKNLVNGDNNKQWQESVTDVYMKNNEYTKKVILSLVNEKFDTATKGLYTGETKEQLDTSKDVVDLIDGLIDNYFEENKNNVQSVLLQGLHEGMSSDAKLFSDLKTGLKTADYFEACARDYTDNLVYLNDLQKSLGVNTTLGKAVEDVKRDYEHHFKSRMVDVITSSVKFLSSGDIKVPDLTTEDGRQSAIVDWVDKTLNTRFDLVDTGIQLVTDQMPSLDAVNTVIYNSYMRTEAIFALKRAERNLEINGKNEQNLAEYKAIFDMAKSLTEKQYEAMLSYYQSAAYGAFDKNEKISFIQNELAKLDTITYTDYHCNGALKLF